MVFFGCDKMLLPQHHHHQTQAGGQSAENIIEFKSFSFSLVILQL